MTLVGHPAVLWPTHNAGWTAELLAKMRMLLHS